MTNNVFITDLDHTFLKSDLSISPFTKEVWNTLSQNKTLSIATARSYEKSKSLLKGLNLNAPLILLDGTMVLDENKKILSLKTVDKKVCQEVIKEGNKFDIEPFIVALKDDYKETFLAPLNCNENQQKVLQNYKNDPRRVMCEEIKPQEKTLKLVYFGKFEQLNIIKEKLQEKFKEELEYKLAPEKYFGDYFLTILHKDGDKAHALKEVATHLKQDPQNMTVFGDSINDIGMFKLAGTSIAVANALKELKDFASIVLKETNDQDGVAKYLKRTN